MLRLLQGPAELFRRLGTRNAALTEKGRRDRSSGELHGASLQCSGTILLAAFPLHHRLLLLALTSTQPERTLAPSLCLRPLPSLLSRRSHRAQRSIVHCNHSVHPSAASSTRLDELRAGSNNMEDEPPCVALCHTSTTLQLTHAALHQ